jgi:chemotaxis methyl-accepting protein methylase
MSVALPDATVLDIALVEWAQRHLGFDRRALRLERLRETAVREAERLGWPVFLEALRQGEPGLDAALITAATVGETYFFRQREHFDLLRTLPFKGSDTDPLRAWSAACASGEEVYSLAITLRQLGFEAPALEVWGTDINQGALDSAKAASYGKWSFRMTAVETETPDPAVESVRAEALRQQVLDPRTQACVKFARHNLLESPRFDGQEGPRFHLIFCRNALVYFQSRAADRAIAHLVRALVPGGWLIMGNMDIAHCPEGMRQVGSARLCVFERLAKDLPVAAPKRPLPPLPALIRPRLAKLPAPEQDPEMAIDWHRGIMAQLELNRVDAAILELQYLVEAFPQYLPGWFEQGLALSRYGQLEQAAHSLRQVLSLARGRNSSQVVAGPEALSLDFYVSNAEAFLNSQGEDLP